MLSEIEDAKRVIKRNFSMASMKTLLWTGTIRNIPENVSFGLSEEAERRLYQTKLQSKFQNSEEKASKTDELDLKIIGRLTENGRSPFRRIAEDLGVTTDTVARRYKRLKDEGLLKTVIQICPKKLGYNANVDFRVEGASHNNMSLMLNSFSEIPDIFHISGTSGDYDLHIWALIRDLEHMFLIREKTASMPDLGKIDMEVNKMFMDVFPSRAQLISTA